MKNLLFLLLACASILISVRCATGQTINYPAAEQGGILKNIELSKGRGIEPSSSGGLKVYYFERPPYYFTEQGRVSGFLVELVRKILEDAGIEASYEVMPSKRIIAEIKDRNIFACSIGWFKNPEREKFANFTLPIYQNRPIVALATRHNRYLIEIYTTLKEMLSDRSIKLGVISGFSYGAYIDQAIKDFSPEMESVNGDQLQLVKMLSAGRITYMLIAPEEIEALIFSAGLNTESFVGVSLSDIPSGNLRYIMCGKGVDEKILGRINRSIQKLVDITNFK